MFLLIAYGAGRWALRAQKGLLGILEVILHIGAHRTGTSSLQMALQQNKHNLMKNDVVWWGPKDTRGGVFSGMLRQARPRDRQRDKMIARNRGVIAIELERMQTRGAKTLLVSEENILGAMMENLRTGLLYPGLEGRLQPFAEAFHGKLARIGMAIRPYGDYWSSVLGYGIRTGRMAPDEGALDRLVTQPRHWRRVVADVARAFPGVEVTVWEFDRLIGRPQAQYRLLTGGRGWIAPMAEKRNASPGRAVLREMLLERGQTAAAAAIAPGDGRYAPFGAHHLEAFAGQYQADLDWLRARSEHGVNFAEGDTDTPTPAGWKKRGFG